MSPSDILNYYNQALPYPKKKGKNVRKHTSSDHPISVSLKFDECLLVEVCLLFNVAQRCGHVLFYVVL